MSGKLELVREEKLFRLLPGRRSSRLEASGVALVDDKTALVVFDNLNQVARIDLSLKRRASNRLMPAPSLGLGFEDIAIDSRHGRVFCLIEAMEDVDGLLHGFVAEYDRAGRFLRCARLHARFQEANKGFEGLAHAWRGGRECLYALWERNHGRSAERGSYRRIRSRPRRGLEDLASNPPAEAGRVQGLCRARVSRPATCRRLAGVGAPVGGPGRRERASRGAGIGGRLSLSEQELRQCRGHRLVVP